MPLLDLLNTPVFTLAGVPVPWSDLLGNICAIATVFLALRRNILSWPVQILGSILLLSASIGAGLGGNASRQVVIIAAAVWGWTRWKQAKQQTASGEVEVRWGTWRERILLLAFLVVGTAAFGTVLAWGGWSWNPYPDAYIFIGSLAAMVAQGRAIVEFWFVWLLVDLVGIPLAISGGLVFSGVVYLIFLVMVILGIVDWSRRSKQRIASPTDLSPDVSRPDPA